MLISPPKSKRFESRETIDRTTNQGGHSKDVSVSNRLGEFETILRKMEASSPKGHSKARGVSQSGAVKRKAVRTQTLRHSMRPGPVSKLQRPIWRDVSSDGAKTSIDGGEKIIFQKKWAVPRAVAGQRRRRIIRHFPQQVVLRIPKYFCLGNRDFNCTSLHILKGFAVFNHLLTELESEKFVAICITLILF